MSDENDDKKLVVEVLLTMYRENMILARHYESQRSTITTIYTSLGAALIALIVALWQQRGDIDWTFLPLAALLVLWGISGFFMVMKMFEKSIIGRTISEAYMNTVKKVVEPDARRILGPRVHEIEYIANAQQYMANPRSRKPWDYILYRGNKAEAKEMIDQINAQLADPNPMEPRRIAIPIHNAQTKLFGIFWARVPQKYLWTVPYFCFGFVGVALAIATAF
jgi:hypothetical protein